MKTLRLLIGKEIKQDYRNKANLVGLVLYLSSTVFICYLVLGGGHKAHISPQVWVGLYWITFLFTMLHVTAKGFVNEERGTHIYLYTVASAQAILLSKIAYHTLLTILLAVVGYLLFALWLMNPIQNIALFIVTLLLSSIGFSAALTLVSALASKTRNSAILMAVLGFPTLISLLMLSVDLTINSITNIGMQHSWKNLLTLASINILIGTVSFLLFPYVWRS